MPKANLKVRRPVIFERNDDSGKIEFVDGGKEKLEYVVGAVAFGIIALTVFSIKVYNVLIENKEEGD